MTDLEKFMGRLKRIGIVVELSLNVPWVYLRSVNGVKVTKRYRATHGFTVYFTSTRLGARGKFTDIAEIFKTIRVTLAEGRENINECNQHKEI